MSRPRVPALGAGTWCAASTKAAMSSFLLRGASGASFFLSMPNPRTLVVRTKPRTLCAWPTATSRSRTNLQEAQSGEFAPHRVGHLGEARLGLVDVGRRGLRLVIAPALEGAHRTRRDRDHRAVEPEPAAADPVRVHERLDAHDRLPGRDLALDDPVERAAVQDICGALRRHARHM